MGSSTDAQELSKTLLNPPFAEVEFVKLYLVYFSEKNRFKEPYFGAFMERVGMNDTSLTQFKVFVPSSFKKHACFLRAR
jgi:hypothetical protein